MKKTALRIAAYVLGGVGLPFAAFALIGLRAVKARWFWREYWAATFEACGVSDD